jgi:hypothetical protein
VAFHSPELLSADETALFDAYRRDKWSARDTRDTEWMTIEKAQAALDDLRAESTVPPAEIDAIGSFIQQWSGRSRIDLG